MLDENKEKRVSAYVSLLKDSVKSRLNFTLQTASVSAVIFSILSISGIFSNNQCGFIFIKFFLSIFLFTIFVSSFLYMYETNKAGVRAKKALEEEINKKLPKHDKNLIDWLGVYFPWIFLVLLFLGIIFMVSLLWI